MAISGSTGGLGKALCAHMAALGVARLILLDRNAGKAEALKNALTAAHPDLCVEFVLTDLADMHSVENAAKTLETQPIDALILNAGAYSIPRHTCDTGYDNVYQINFISPYFLARTLIPEIRKKGGKIVAVSSIAHDYSKIDENDVDFRTREKSSSVYGNAKRFLTYSLMPLEDVNITHPGITLTNITAHYPEYIFKLIKRPMKIIFMSPEKASLCILAGLFSSTPASEESWIGPKFWGIWGLPCKRPLSTATQEEKDSICAIADNIFNELSEIGETL